MIIISQLFRGKNRKIWLSIPPQPCRCRKAALKKQQGSPCCFSNRTDYCMPYYTICAFFAISSGILIPRISASFLLITMVYSF